MSTALSDFCTISFRIHLTHRVHHTVLSCSYRKTSFAFPKGLAKPLNLESLPHQENKKLQNKLPSHHFKSFNERIQNEVLLPMPVCLDCSPTAVPPAWYGGAPRSPAINMQCPANTFRHSKTIKNSFQECSGRWEVRSEHVEAALPQAEHNKQVLDPACSHGTQSL